MNLSKYNIYSMNDKVLRIINTKSGAVVDIDDKKLKSKIFLLKENKDVEFDKNIKDLINFGIITNSPNENFHSPYLTTLTITLFVTNECNFRCSYCYEKFNNNKMSNIEYMSILNFIENQLDSKKFNNLKVNLFGGEPLLEFDKILNFLKELNIKLAKKNFKNLSVGLTSNGYLLDIDKYKKLVELGLKDIQITVDGFSNTHNNVRKLINGDKTWLTIMKNLENICLFPKHTKVILRTNFNMKILEREKDFILYCKKKFHNEFIMHFESIKKFNPNYNQEYLTLKEELEFIVELIKFCKCNKIRHQYENILEKGSLACAHNIENSFIFDTNLNVLRCTVLLNSKEVYNGKLLNNGKLDINFKNDWIIEDHNCLSCNLYPLCMGKQCPARKRKNLNKCINYGDLLDKVVSFVNMIY